MLHPPVAAAVPVGAPEAAFSVLRRAPIMVLLLDARLVVKQANEAAQAFFNFTDDRLPESLIVLTRELRLEAAIHEARRGQSEVRLVHRPSTLRVSVADSPDGDRLAFLTDISELSRLETVRQEFVANLSHELRTPLTSLRLAAETLSGSLPEADRITFAERVVQEADHLAAIIDNLRQLAEIESGKPVVRQSRVRLEELLTEIVARTHLEDRVTIKADRRLVIRADREKLAQAAANLLDNAAKFSPAGSAIDLEAKLTDGELLISVRDLGPGISPEHWNRVFERFYKVDPSRSRDIPGSGLGLAITKHLVLLMGGRAWTEAGEGGGQVFLMAIPATLAIPAAKPVRKAKPVT